MSKQPIITDIVPDFEVGASMFKRGMAFELCTTDEMRNGWNEAENTAAWALFRSEPKQAVGFSLAALNAASKRSVWEFETFREECDSRWA